MGMRELMHTILNYLPFREESELLAARKQVDDEWPPPGAQDSEESKRDTGAGVFGASGERFEQSNGTNGGNGGDSGAEAPRL